MVEYMLLYLEIIVNDTDYNDKNCQSLHRVDSPLLQHPHTPQNQVRQLPPHPIEWKRPLDLRDESSHGVLSEDSLSHGGGEGT